VKAGVNASSGPTKARTWASAILIAAVALSAYATSFSGAFQFDDFPSIVENPTLRSLWPLTGPLAPPRGALTVSGRPALNFSFALNYAASGYHEWSYHLLNLAIHVCAALCLFGIVRRTLRGLGDGNPDAPALVSAMVWAVHPVTTESVTYIVQRAESLMGLLYLATLYFFVRSVDTTNASFRRAWLVLSVLACWAGVATKEVMVTAPVAVILYDRIFVQRSWTRTWRARRGYYFSLASSWLLLGWLVGSTGWDRGGTSGFHVGVSWIGYWLTQGEAMARYLIMAVWPRHLSIEYGPASAPTPLACGLVLLVLAGFAVTVAAVVRGRHWSFLPACCFLILAPTSVMPGVLQYVAEHRMYLPLAAVVVGAVLSVRSAFRMARLRETATWAMALFAAAVVACLTVATSQRNLLYSDDLALWSDTVASHPLSALAQANLGKALLDRRRTSEGIAHCKMSVDIDPNKPAARYNLGMAYEEQHRWDDALKQYASAASLNPKLFSAEFRAGRILDSLGRSSEAERYLRQAVENEPRFAEAHSSLAVALTLQDRNEEAIEEYNLSLAIDPFQPEAEFNQGLLLARCHREAEATAHYQHAVRLRPGYGEAQLNLGIALAQSGDLAQAFGHLRKAADLMPLSPQAHESLATLLDGLGRTDDAIDEYQAALRLRPDFADAHYNFGNTLIHARRWNAARDEFAEALRLRPGFEAARTMRARLEGAPSDRK
jgi:protein O-mannosyl-transferase